MNENCYFGFFKAPVADMIAVLTPDELVVMVTTGGLIILVVIIIGLETAALGCESHFDFLLCSITENNNNWTGNHHKRTTPATN